MVKTCPLLRMLDLASTPTLASLSFKRLVVMSTVLFVSFFVFFLLGSRTPNHLCWLPAPAIRTSLRSAPRPPTSPDPQCLGARNDCFWGRVLYGVHFCSALLLLFLSPCCCCCCSSFRLLVVLSFVAVVAAVVVLTVAGRSGCVVTRDLILPRSKSLLPPLLGAEPESPPSSSAHLGALVVHQRPSCPFDWSWFVEAKYDMR